MSSETENLIERIYELSKKAADLKTRRRARKELIDLLAPFLRQGEGSGLNADLLDGLHAAEIIDKASKLAPRGGGGGIGSHSHEATVKTTMSFAVVGTLATGSDKAPTLVAPCPLTIVKVKLVVKTAPTGAAIIVDVNKAGVTIFTTQGNRPQIAAGATTGDSGTPDVTSLAEGDKITVDVDQIGSGTAGADLTVEVVCTQNVAFS